MGLLERFGFKSKEQKEKEQLDKAILEKQKELVLVIKQLNIFNQTLAEGGRMVPGDTTKQGLLEERIENIKKELEDLKAGLPKN